MSMLTLFHPMLISFLCAAQEPILMRRQRRQQSLQISSSATPLYEPRVLQRDRNTSKEDVGYGRTGAHVGVVRSRFSCSQFGPEGTKCPTPAWVNEMVRIDPLPGKTIVSIGCHMGHDAVRWMELWDMSAHFWSQARWLQHLGGGQLVDTTFVCPPTQNFVTAPMVKPELNGNAVPTGVCVEPMLEHVRLLKDTSEALGYSANTHHGAFHIVRAALVGKPATNDTKPRTNSLVGVNREHVNDLMHTEAPVPLKTLDTIMEDLGLHDADILLIDTQGYDADVFKGARMTLPSVRYVEFAMHNDAPRWSGTGVKSVLNELDMLGFDCYWAGSNGKLMDIKKCWRNDFETGMWSNAACVRTDDSWSGVLRQFAV